MLWSVSAALVALVLRLLFEPITGETNAALLSAGVVVACNLSWVELCRLRDDLDVDRLLLPAQTIYAVVLVPVTPTIANLMLQIQPGAPPWLRVIAYPAVYATVLFLLIVFSYLLCRISFSAAEMRESGRRRRERAQQRTIVQ
jgi:hypothetical protein